MIKDIYYPTDNIVKEVSAIQKDDKIILKVRYESNEYIKQPNFGFVIYDNYENPIFGTNPIKNGITDFGIPKKRGEVKIVINSPHLVNGSYPVSVWFNDGLAYSNHIFHKDNCLNLNVNDMNISFIHKESNLGNIIPDLKFIFN